MWRITSINNATHQVTITDMVSGAKHSFTVPDEHAERNKKLLYIQTVMDEQPRVILSPLAENLTVPDLVHPTAFSKALLIRYIALLLTGIGIGLLCHLFL